jgi:hypothetical protein
MQRPGIPSAENDRSRITDLRNLFQSSALPEKRLTIAGNVGCNHGMPGVFLGFVDRVRQA